MHMFLNTYRDVFNLAYVDSIAPHTVLCFVPPTGGADHVRTGTAHRTRVRYERSVDAARAGWWWCTNSVRKKLIAVGRITPY